MCIYKPADLFNQACFKDHFKEILLIIVFNFPHYEHSSLLLDAYGKAFPNIIFCGPENSTSYSSIMKSLTSKGYFSYDECAARAMRIHNNYSGYLVMSDDVFLNFWNLKNLNPLKIWDGPKAPIRIGNHTNPLQWYWWQSRWGVNSCFKALKRLRSFNKFENLLKNLGAINTSNSDLRKNISGENICYGGRSDIYYIPKKMARTFSELSKIFKEENVFLEIAVSTIIRILTTDMIFLKGIYMPGKVGSDPVTKSDIVLKYYRPELHFVHPLKLNYGENSRQSLDFLKNYVQKIVDSLVIC